jgi:hypothetical protein
MSDKDDRIEPVPGWEGKGQSEFATMLEGRLREREERIRELEAVRDELTQLIVTTTKTPLARLTEVLESVDQVPARGRGGTPLIFRDTRTQFGVAVAVMSAIPLLAFGYLLNQALREQSVSIRTATMMVPPVVALVGVGILLLLRHTSEMTRLRQQLDGMARGRIPEVEVRGASEDFAAVEKNLSAVIKQTDEKIRGIESSSRSQLRAEQHRVMIETVGAACHHLGQPVTVITAYLELMRKKETDPELIHMIAECQAAADEVAAILHRLKTVAQYRTEPYLTAKDAGDGRPDERILKI